MKKLTFFVVLGQISLLGASHAALSLVNSGSNSGTGTPDSDIILSADRSDAATRSAWDGWNFAGGPTNSSRANAYLDANQNGILGEAGENTGNTPATLTFSYDITDGSAVDFYVTGFGNVDSTGNAAADRLTIQLSDDSRILVGPIADGGSTTFMDGADEWQIGLTWAYDIGDPVFNGGIGPGSGTNDSRATLSFTLVPEPGSVSLIGLAALGMILRRRR